MNDSYPNSKSADKPRTLLERLTDFISPEPESRAELFETLQDAYAYSLIDADFLPTIEGVLQVSDLCTRDIIIPRAQTDVSNTANALSEFIPFVQRITHSRFPVHEGSRDNIIGTLLAKDLSCFYTDEDFDVCSMLCPTVFIPGSKRLNALLRDFRVNHNHIAIVVDEYDGVADLITIEGVLEQTVGDIEDEYDFDQEEDNILSTVDGHIYMCGLIETSQFSEVFDTHFSDEDVDTVGELLSNHLGRMPYRGEKIATGTLQFDVLRADMCQVQVLLARRLTTPAGGNVTADTSGSHPV